MSIFLRLLLVVCWVLTASISVLVGGIVVRRWLRQRQFRRLDRWWAELEEQLPRWAGQRRPPWVWLRDRVRRELLVEALLSQSELEGRMCTERGYCPLVSPEAGVRCEAAGQACAAPAFFRQLVEELGLVDHQIGTVRGSFGLGRAQAVILLGRMRQPRTIPILAELLDDFDPDVRLAAVRALGLLGTPEAAQPLLGLLHRLKLRVSIPSLQRALISCCEQQPRILLPHLARLKRMRQSVLMRVLAEIATPGTLPVLEELATADEPQVRAHVARALGRLPAADVIPLLVRLAHDPVWFVRVRALRALGPKGGWDTVEVMLDGLNSGQPDVQRAAAESLAQQSLPLDDLIRRARLRLTPEGWGVLLGELGRSGLFWVLAQQLGSPSQPVRQLAQQWLREALAAGAHKTVLDALSHPNPDVVDGVADFLASWGDSSLLGDLEELMQRTPPASPHHQRLRQLREEIAARTSS